MTHSLELLGLSGPVPHSISLRPDYLGGCEITTSIVSIYLLK